MGHCTAHGTIGRTRELGSEANSVAPGPVKMPLLLPLDTGISDCTSVAKTLLLLPLKPGSFYSHLRQKVDSFCMVPASPLSSA